MKYTSKYKNEDELTHFLASRYKYLREDVFAKTQEEWAEVLNVSSTHISNIEMKKYRSSLWLLLKTCDVCNITVDDFLKVPKKTNSSNLDEMDKFLSELSNEQLNLLYTFLRKIENRLNK